MLATAISDKLRHVRLGPDGAPGLLAPPAAAPRVRQQWDGRNDPPLTVNSAAAGALVLLAVATVSVVVLLLHYQQQQLLPNELQRVGRRLRHIFPLAGHR